MYSYEQLHDTDYIVSGGAAQSDWSGQATIGRLALRWPAIVLEFVLKCVTRCSTTRPSTAAASNQPRAVAIQVFTIQKNRVGDRKYVDVMPHHAALESRFWIYPVLGAQ